MAQQDAQRKTGACTRGRRLVSTLVTAACLPVFTAAAAPEEASKSAPVAQALCKHLEQAKLQYIAARDPSDPSRYVAAMHFPGLQLMVVSAKYAAPSLLNEKIIQRKYQDAYIDLNSASERATRIIFEDLKANGMARTKVKDQPPDAYEVQGKRVVFDFDWRKQKITEDDYFKALTRADDEYARVLTLLLEEAKKP
jgi:hypothetical protein